MNQADCRRGDRIRIFVPHRRKHLEGAQTTKPRGPQFGQLCLSMLGLESLLAERVCYASGSDL